MCARDPRPVLGFKVCLVINLGCEDFIHTGIIQEWGNQVRLHQQDGPFPAYITCIGFVKQWSYVWN